MVKLGFLASGGGSSARAMVEASRLGKLAAEPALLVSNRPQAPALAWARELGLPTLCIPTTPDPVEADARLAQAMVAHGVEVVVLSGYLRRIGPQMLARYGGRMLNIHPGPLPAFGGAGMHGRRVHEAVIAAGLAASEIVIHLVDEEYDRGAVLARRAIPTAGCDAAALEARVRAEEPGFYVETLQRYISDNIP